jgi:hypothetical protein
MSALEVHVDHRARLQAFGEWGIAWLVSGREAELLHLPPELDRVDVERLGSIAASSPKRSSARSNDIRSSSCRSSVPSPMRVRERWVTSGYRSRCRTVAALARMTARSGVHAHRRTIGSSSARTSPRPRRLERQALAPVHCPGLLRPQTVRLL